MDKIGQKNQKYRESEETSNPEFYRHIENYILKIEREK